MSKREFDAACKKYGFEPQGFSYYRLPLPNRYLSVSVWNMGTRRNRLAYLFACLKREQKRSIAQ